MPGSEVITVGKGVSVEFGGGVVGAYLARPRVTGCFPGILVIHEAWGLNNDIKSIADRFASSGYVALAPDLIGGGWRCLLRAYRELSRGSGRSLDLAHSWLTWLSDREDVDGDRLAVAGFCLGGGFAFLLGVEPVVRAIAPSYGRVPSDEHLRRLCPVVASYGQNDRAFRSQAERLKRVLSDARVPHDVKIYTGAGHSFMNRDAPWFVRLIGPVLSVGFDPAAAEDSWRRILAFLDEQL